VAYDKDRAIAAQNAATAAATVYAAIVSQGTPEWDANLYDNIRTAIFNGTLALGGAEAVVERFEGVVQEVQASVPAAPAATQTGPLSDAGNVDIRNGKHAGKTIKQVFAEDPTYLEWAAANLDRNQFLRDKIREFLASAGVAA
jgi:hypothetical protein